MCLTSLFLSSVGLSSDKQANGRGGGCCALGMLGDVFLKPRGTNGQWTREKSNSHNPSPACMATTLQPIICQLHYKPAFNSPRTPLIGCLSMPIQRSAGLSPPTVSPAGLSGQCCVEASRCHRPVQRMRIK